MGSIDPQSIHEDRVKKMSAKLTNNEHKKELNRKIQQLLKLIVKIKPKISKIKHETIRKQYEDRIGEIPDWTNHVVALLPTLQDPDARQFHIQKVDELLSWAKLALNNLSKEPLASKKKEEVIEEGPVEVEDEQTKPRTPQANHERKFLIRSLALLIAYMEGENHQQHLHGNDKKMLMDMKKEFWSIYTEWLTSGK